MIHSLAIRKEANNDIKEAYRWYESQRLDQGVMFKAQVKKTLDLLRHVPLMGRVVFHDVRQVRVRGFPYTIKYLVEKGVIVVLAVWHDKRDPDKWKSRIE